MELYSYDIGLVYHSGPIQYRDTDWWQVNARGFRLGGDYVLDKKMAMWSFYTLAEDIGTGAKRNGACVELDMWL